MPKTGRGKEARAASRRIVALRLRQEGRSFREIARATKTSIGQAFADVDKSLAELGDLRHKEAEKLLTLELARLDRMYSAISRKANKGDLYAIDRALQISKLRNELLGLTGRRAVGDAGATDNGIDAGSPPAPNVSVTVINQTTAAQINEVLAVAKEYGLMDRLLGLTAEAPSAPATRIEIEGQHAGNGNGHGAGNGNGSGH